jgi:hypothetical protein
MTLWLESKEKIFQHVQWRLDSCPAPPTIEPLLTGIVYERYLKMTKHPTWKAVKINALIADYGDCSFRDALAHFIIQFNNPTLTCAQIETQSGCIALHFNRVPFITASSSSQRIPIPQAVLRTPLLILYMFSPQNVEVWDFQHSHSLVLFHGHLA